jgi:prephenate dehydratase
MPGVYGVLPIEDSINGEWMSSLDRLIFGSAELMCSEEVVLVEQIRAFGLAGADHRGLRLVVSHADILRLCEKAIVENGLLERRLASTEEGCKSVAHERDASQIALAPPAVAEAYGLEEIDLEVSDVPDIRTRYLLVGRGIAAPTDRDRTSFVVTPEVDRSGTLLNVIEVLAEHELNMVSLASRPIDQAGARHAFHVVLEGHISQPHVRQALLEILRRGSSVKLLGCYPQWTGPEVTTPYVDSPAGSIISSGDLNALFDKLIADQRPSFSRTRRFSGDYVPS